MDNKLSIRTGMPTVSFLREAWSDETLTAALPGISCSVAFSPPESVPERFHEGRGQDSHARGRSRNAISHRSLRSASKRQCAAPESPSCHVCEANA